MYRVLLTLAVLVLSVGLQAEPLTLQPYESLVGPLPESTLIPEEVDRALRSGPGESGVPVALEGDGDYIRDLTLRTLLSPSAQESLDIVPEWLRIDLYDMFTRMSQNDQEDYGQLLLSVSDPRLIDEVAFTIAHSSRSILSSSDPDLYVVNAQLLYQVDPEISYADILDYGEPGVDPDYYSTILYTSIVSGATVRYELPLDIYYWFVVHPKLGDEDPSMSPTLTEQTSTYGYFWREYLFYNPSEEFDYTIYRITKFPNMLEVTDVDSWGPTAVGYLEDGSRQCPEGIIVGGPGIERPVLVEYNWSYGRIVMTTMDLERAYNAGHREALENVLMRSSGHESEFMVPYTGSGYFDQIGIIEETGDAQVLNPILQALDDNGIRYIVLTVDEIVQIERWEEYFTKILIPSYQDRDTYEAIASEGFMAKLNEWVGIVGGTVEFHGACDPENDWSDLQLFKLSYVADEIDDVAINRFPVLGEVIGCATHVWDDSYLRAGLPRYRPFEEDSMAVDVITNWASRMLWIQARGNRPLQPNQICFEHNGNCGEIQDLINAAARTCLVPSAGVNNHTWDHVSCEFWDRDWHGYQVGWNVGSASIANQGVLSDKDLGGGKDLSAILQDRGDTWPVNATERYSEICRFHVRVEDVNGNPVDCAEIWPYVYDFNDPTRDLKCPLIAYTDSSGEVIMDLGNKRDFWFRVKSRAGDVHRPQEPLLTDTVAGQDYEHTFVVDGFMPQLPDIEAIEFPPVPQSPYGLFVSYNVDYETQYSLSMGSFGNKNYDAGNVDFFILKSDDFNKYSDGEAFSAYEWRHDSAGDEFEVDVPDDEVYYLVFSNEDTLIVKEFVSIFLQVYQNNGGAWTPAESYSNFVGIPAGDSYVIMFNNRLAPSVYAAGFFDAEVDSSGSFELGVQAFVLDPSGPHDVREVELCYGGVPLGRYLKDDGRYDDAIAGDGIFTFSERHMPGTLYPGVYKLEIVATDMAGNKSISWPYLNVLSIPLRLTSPTCSMNTNIWQPAATADSAPVILGGGFFGRDAIPPGGIFRIIVYADDPDGLSDIDRVELFLEGGVPTGVLLHDDGADGDDHAGDGIYTFQTSMPPGIPPGPLTLEVVAFDKSGNISARYPYFTVR